MMLFGPGDGMVLYEKAKGLVEVVVDFAEDTLVTVRRKRLARTYISGRSAFTY